VLPVLQRSVNEGKALRLRYYSASRDETTERTIDPVRVFEADGLGYVEAWCRQAEGMRIFRADRIEDVQLLDEPSRPPADVELRDISEGVFAPAPDHLLVQLRLMPAYAWVADYYATENITEDAGVLTVDLRVSDPGWVSVRPARSRCSHRTGSPNPSAPRPNRRSPPTSRVEACTGSRSARGLACPSSRL